MNLQMIYDLRNAEKALPARVRKSIEENRSAGITRNAKTKDATPSPHCEQRQGQLCGKHLALSRSDSCSTLVYDGAGG
jgi:hypothetical protein